MRLIGRTGELATLLAAVRREHGMTLLSGEAGIGKTRLTEEVLAEAADHGVTALIGRAHPLHASLAYAPIVEALRPALRSVTDFAALTDLGRLFGDPRLPVSPPLENPTAERERMFTGVSELIRQVGPAVLVVDDVHWADQGTVALLRHVSRHAPVLVTSRTGESPIDADTVVRLGPLSDAEVIELATGVLGTAPDPVVLERAQGVPLFVTALLQGGFTELPEVVKDVVLARLDRLVPADRRLIELIAVAADAPGSLLGDPTAVARLVGQGLVVEKAGRYGVAHPLYAEVAYDSLTVGERRALHAAVIGMLDDPVALAPHYLQAGDLADQDKAAAVLAEAGRRAMRVNATDEAIRYLTAAVQFTEHDLTLRDHLGQAHLRAGQVAEAQAQWTRVAELARQYGDNETLSALRFRLAVMASEVGDAAVAEAHARAGSVPVRHTASQTIALRMLYTLRHNTPDRLRLIVEHFDVPPDPHPAAVASEALRQHLIALLDGDLRRARDQAAKAVEYGGQWEQDWPLLDNFATHQLVSLSAAVGDVADARAHAERTQAMQTYPGVSASGTTARLDLNLVAYLAGDLEAAAAGAATAVDRARQAGIPRSLARALSVRALLLAERGSLVRARECLAEAAAIRIRPEAGVTALVESARTALALYSGQRADVPEVSSWALYHEPLAMIVRMIFAWRAEVVPPSTGHCPLLDAVAQHDADRLAEMGALVLAAEARVADRPTTTEIQHSLAVFEQTGARPLAERTRRIARAAGVHVPHPPGVGPLTSRETDVVRLVGHGLSNADIAAQLLISERTVEAHLTSSYAKLGVTSRILLAQWAAEHTEG
nr:AAA family ATPase [Kibdelosporangium sp. MJ126-NF4]CEL22562.1 large transcriptional regulator [Kibdelosporangium sp. MJ126-NF4]CTQ89418.1 large transcriptional regulator [Kibdelosporangium sp. MJ126-NF4]